MLDLIVYQMRWEAPSVVSVELRSKNGNALPAFSAGAHVDLQLTPAIQRSYSLLNDPNETHRYVLGVLKERAGKGGSAYVHDQLRVGQSIKVREPINNFQLVEDAPHSLLIAGGIGVTPMISMARRLTSLAKPFTLLYCVRFLAEAAFVSELRELCGASLVLYSDEEQGAPPNLVQLISQYAQANSHLYCCGPAPMLSAYEQACQGRDPETVHLERFHAVEMVASSVTASYEVELVQSKKVLIVEPGKSLLQTMLDDGIDAPYSCMDGICGTCETKVLSGEIEHRDSILTDAERASGKTMMTCVSGCKSARLVLDL